MLKQLLKTGVILAFVLFVAGFAGIVWDASSKPPRTQDIYSHNQYNKTQYGTNDQSDDFWRWITHDAITFFTFMLALFTLALVIVSAIQIRFLIRADRPTQQTIILSQRPRLRVRNVVVTPANPAFVARIGVFQPRTYVSGQFYMVNVGGTEAQITDGLSRIFWDNRDTCQCADHMKGTTVIHCFPMHCCSQDSRSRSFSKVEKFCRPTIAM